MKKILSLFLLLAAPAYLSAQDFDWVKGGGGTGTEFSCGAVVDAAGNTYVAGSFSATATFGPFSLVSAGNTDVFIAKYDAAGVVQWAIAEGGTQADYANGIYYDGAGNLYVTGGYDGTALFGNVSLTATAGMFLARYDASGNLQWAQQLGNGGNEYTWSVAADVNGNACVAGYFTNTMTIGSTTLTANSNAETFIARYNAAGNFLWAKQMGSATTDLAYGIAVSSTGNIVATGRFEGTAQFGSITLTSAGMNDIFVTCLDSSGNFNWTVKAGGTADESGQDIKVDAAGNVLVTGYFKDTAYFGTTMVISHGGSDCFITKYDGSGAFQWLRRAGGAGDDYGSGISCSLMGVVFVTGYFNGTATFGPNTLSAAGGRDVFVSRQNATGNFQWVMSGGGAGNEYGRSICYRDGRISVTGISNGAGLFGIHPLSNLGQDDAFVARITDWDVGVNETANPAAIAVFPNPSAGDIIFQLDEAAFALNENMLLTLSDAAGRKLSETRVVNAVTVIDSRNFSAGIYFYTLSSANGVLRSGKVVVE